MIMIFLLVLCIVNIGGYHEGETCTKEGVAGVCVNIRVCPDAQQDIKNMKYPKLCEFQHADPIVCCVTAVSGTTMAAPAPVLTSTTGCQRYFAHGYRYEHMWDIDGIALDNTVVKREDNDLKYFDTHLAIKAPRDGLVILSPKEYPGAKDLVFEIGIGIGANQFTVVRVTKDSSDEVARVSTPNILSTDHYTRFFIKIFNDVLTIGKEGESPIITYSDIRLRTIKYFDISSWGVFDGNFLYDCPAITSANNN